MPLRAAVKSKGIPKEALHGQLMHTPSKQGGKTMLTEEELIVIMLEKYSFQAWPVGFDKITLMVESYSCGKTERWFKDNLPGED